MVPIPPVPSPGTCSATRPWAQLPASQKQRTLAEGILVEGGQTFFPHHKTMNLDKPLQECRAARGPA